MTFTARRRHPAAHPLSRLPMLLALGLALGLPGCGGSDGRTGAPGPDGTGGVTALLEMATEPTGTNCANGGTRVSAGLDADADTVLSAGEISDVKYICSGVQGATGASGTTGLTSLVTVVAEPAGSNCLLGGSKITAGLDASANGVLELAEVSTTNHVCNGDTGAGGATGAVGVSGVTSLVTVVAEPAGAHCTAGGNRASVGLDSNRDGVLDVSEISSISYMCHGETGATGSNGVASLIAPSCRSRPG